MNALKKFFRRLHINIFTLVMLASAVMFTFKVANVISFKPGTSGLGAVMDAQAVQSSTEEPPPLDAAAMKAAVNKTLADLEADTDKPAATKTSEKVATEPANRNNDDNNRVFSSSEIEVLQSLSKRRDDLEKREQRLETREALLSAAEQEVDRKVMELNTLKGEIEVLLGKQQTMEDERIISLVKIYENMKPKEAADIFNTLDMTVLLPVISRMSERKSSPILAAMTPEKARIVTIRMAEQRKLPLGALDGANNNKPAAPAATPMDKLPGLANLPAAPNSAPAPAAP